MVIEFTRENRIAIFTINRPEAANAMNVKGFQELHDALVEFRDDDSLLAGILTGSGDKAFCAGVDIKDFLPFIRETARKPWLVPATMQRRMDLWKPLIAAINGVALGGGLELALGCDIRIASENAKLGLPEVTLGVFPGGGSTQRLPRLIPPGLAAEMLFTGKRIDAQEAYRIGLVNKVTPVGKALAEAKTIAEAICQAGPIAVQAVKQSMIKGENMTLDEGLFLEETMGRIVTASKDFNEGITAFIEKRKPQYKGE
jgi:enoyl-CoA hydratase/carnithine racemase